MNPNDANNSKLTALDQLKDIRLPDPVGWWPMAFSWWVLLLSLGAMVFSAIWFWLERKRRNAYRREALKKLSEIEHQSLPPARQIQALNALLKQVAMTAYGRRKVAPLHNRAWLDFLKQSAHYIPQPEGLIETLELAYRPVDATQNDAATEQALRNWQVYTLQWIKGHHL